MCIEVSVKRDGKYIYCETVGELADALGVAADEVSDDPAENCLCNAFLSRFGARKATDNEGFPFPEFVIDATSANAEAQPRPASGASGTSAGAPGWAQEGEK